MKVSESQAEEHRTKLIAACARLLQERGFDGAGVADISRAAGLTQGALYSQFKSKGALAAEACRRSQANSLSTLREIGLSAGDPLSAYLDVYLSDTHAKDVAEGCAIAAYGCEVRRQDKHFKAVFTEGFRAAVDMLKEVLPKRLSKREARRRALVMIPAMAGCVIMSRAIEKTDPELAKELLAAARDELERFAVE